MKPIYAFSMNETDETCLNFNETGKMSNFEIIKMIGKGGFSKVLQGMNILDSSLLLVRNKING